MGKGDTSYDAFISYSQRADGKLAPALQSSLQRLSKPWYRRKPFLKIQRDSTSFGASSDLKDTIRSSLDDCGHLVLLLSPGSAASKWTNQEIEHWFETKSADELTVVVTGWQRDLDYPEEAPADLGTFEWNGTDVPPALRGKLDEPLAVDLRWATSRSDMRLKNERWGDAVAQIAAAITGKKKDTLVGELVLMQRKARILNTALVLAALIMLIAIGLSVLGWLVAQRAEDRARADEQAAIERGAEAQAAAVAAEELEAAARRDQLAAESAAEDAERLEKEARDAQFLAEVAADRASRLEQEARDAAAVARDDQAAAELAEQAAQEARAAAEEQARLAAEAQAAADAARAVAVGERDLAQVAQQRAEDAADVADAAAAVATAETERQLAIAESVRLATQSSELLETQPELATLLALESARATAGFTPQAYARAGDPFVTSNAYAALYGAASSPWRTTLRHGDGEVVRETVMSPDGSKVVTIAHFTARVWSIDGELLFTIPGDRVFSAEFSPDGRHIVSEVRSDIDGNHAAVYDTAGVRRAVLTHESGYVGSAHFSPDGTRVVTTARNVRIWNLDGGLVTTLPTDDDSLRDAKYSPGGDRILTLGDHDVRIWSTDGTPQASLLSVDPNTRIVWEADFSPDGTQIVTIDSSSALLWTSDGELVGDLSEPDRSVIEAVFSPSGGQIATRGGEGAQLWGRDATPIATVDGGYVFTMAFTPDGSTLLTTTEVGTNLWAADQVCLRECTPGEWVTGFDHGTEFVNSVTFSSDGSRMVTTTDGELIETLRLWDTWSGELVATFTTEALPNDGQTPSAWFTTDGSRLVFVGGGEASVWDIEGPALSTPAHFVDSAVLSPDSAHVAMNVFGRIEVRDLDGELVTGFDAPGAGGLVLSPDGTRVASVVGGKVMTSWTTDGVPQAEIVHAGAVESVTYSPDGTRILTVGTFDAGELLNFGATEARLWRQTGALDAVYSAGRRVRAAAFSPDGSHVVTVGNGASVWRAEGTQRAFFGDDRSDSGFSSAAFSPDGALIATGADGVGEIWSIDGAPVATLAHGSERTVTDIGFSPDGTQIVTVGGTIARVWRTSDWALLGTLAHDDLVNAASFSPDSKRIATASDDGTAGIWLADGTRLTVFELGQRVASVEFSADDTRILTVSGSATVWPSYDLDHLVATALGRLGTRQLTEAECQLYDIVPCPGG